MEKEQPVKNPKEEESSSMQGCPESLQPMLCESQTDTLAWLCLVVMGFFSFVECVNQKLLMQMATWMLRCLDLDVDTEGTSNDAYQLGPKIIPKTKIFLS